MLIVTWVTVDIFTFEKVYGEYMKSCSKKHVSFDPFFLLLICGSKLFANLIIKRFCKLQLQDCAGIEDR